jgi:hypothetical protein
MPFFVALQDGNVIDRYEYTSAHDPSHIEILPPLDYRSVIVLADGTLGQDDAVYALHHDWEVKCKRIERNDLLLKSDWTQGADSPLSDEMKLAWRAYRQALRDMDFSVSPPA